LQNIFDANIFDANIFDAHLLAGKTNKKETTTISQQLPMQY